VILFLRYTCTKILWVIDPQVGLSGEPFRRCDCYVEPAGPEPDKLYRRALVLVPHSCCGSDIN
jgi:hypothetical protein